MRFRILGPLAVVHDGNEITPTAPKVRQVLAFLLMRSNRVVQVDEFVDELWGDHPPVSALTTLQTYIYKLRKDVLDLSGLISIKTLSFGYRLEVPDEDIDIHRYDDLSSQGAMALRQGDSQRASELLAEALAMWNGRALVGVNLGEILSAYVIRLEENWIRTMELRIDAELGLGRHQELISELKVLTSRYPLHERFYENLMTALSRSGRRWEALETYRRLRRILVDELAVEPSPSVQQLHQALLRSDSVQLPPESEPAAAGAAVTAAQAITLAVPAQLPPDIPDFTGRACPVKQIREWLAPRNSESTAPRIMSIGGLAGTGKTTLAVHAAHMVRAHYPDGQLFADLRGATREPAKPGEILAHFLRAVGVPSDDIPATLDERSKLFRTWSTDKRVLVVLDDAHSTAQVKPLIPAAPECAVLVTHRCGLPGLPGVREIELGAMTAREGLEMLANMIGDNRVASEAEVAETIVNLCGQVPVALRSIGTRMTSMRTWPLYKMADWLEQSPSLLDELRFADFDLRSSYDSVYARLDPPDQSTFRLLSLLPPRQFSAATATELLGSIRNVVESRLSRLVTHHLLEMIMDSGEAEPQYVFNRLTRLYARERLSREYIEPEFSPEQSAPQPDSAPSAVSRPSRAEA